MSLLKNLREKFSISENNHKSYQLYDKITFEEVDDASNYSFSISENNHKSYQLYDKITFEEVDDASNYFFSISENNNHKSYLSFTTKLLLKK